MKIRKLLAVACFGLCLKNSAQAQVDTRPFILSIAPEAGLPVGQFGKTNKFGFGGSFTAQFYMAEKLRLLTSVGGILYQGKPYLLDQYIEEQYPAVALLGLKAGLKYYLTDAVFVAGTVGADNVTQSGEGKLGFSYAPLLGVELGGVDLYAKYNAVNVKSTEGSNVQTVGFCIGYRF